MKRVVFWLGLLTINGVVIGLVLLLFFRNFSIEVHRKNAVSDFTKMEQTARVTAVNTPPFASQEQGQATLVGEQLELRLRHPYCGFKTQPSVRGEAHFYGRDVTFSINEYGHRSATLGKKEPGVVRIAMLGGSVVYLGTSNDTTIVGQLARLANENGYKTEFINAGIVSAISSQELSVLIHELVDLEVDLVISFDGFNDIYCAISYNGRIGWPFNDFTYYPQITPNPNMPDEEVDRVVAHYLNVIHKKSLICQAYGIKYLAVLQPARDYAEFMESDSKKRRMTPIVAFYSKVIDAFQTLDETRANGGHYASFAGLIKKGRFRDVVHFHDDDHALVASRLFELIQREGILPEWR